ncbi:MAG: aminotransferase class I/II-fold pyridoxal phosphate-dependent enzyme [Candidatus Odinarchaeum yellowstonii]|uniref:Aminotransferase class I/II-fold pyridoxal phosphate-dependent enzyme n=1 Tax=Odinarchaeota yellowstonii (strain LCB_4) TaxID=1841599 RepID=A0AAF0IBJ1_ODILC|nr:MAG: aminotransferase class I/II-fold pyridoxal phosphate-dependent enzyme [Candidatus Odinarchaeum yellowstonii]
MWCEKNIPFSPASISDMVRIIENRDKVKVTRFDLAEPCFNPPENALSSTCKAVLEGYNRYSPTKGLLELREGLARFLEETRGVSYSIEEIIVTPGSKFSSYCVFASILKPDDEVILLTPFWSSFKAIPLLLGVKNIKEVLTDPLYKINQERFQNAITRKTRLVVINTPNNPTGGILDRSDLKFIVDLALEKDFYILSDEVDWAYTYDGYVHCSPAAVSDGFEKTIITDSFSKVFCMTGWRVGFSAGPRNIIDKMNIIQQHTVTAPVTFAQKACLDVLTGYKEYIKNVVSLALKKRNMIVEELKKIPRLDTPTPPGAFYIFPRDRCKVRSDNLSVELLNKAHVAVAPGTIFGEGSEYNFRICYALPDEDLKEGVERLKVFFESAST